MSKINIEIIKCDTCGITIKGRSDTGNYINDPEVRIKSKNPELYNLKDLDNLDICYDCWSYYYVPKSKSRKVLFEFIKEELDYDIDDDRYYFEYIGMEYVKIWKDE